VVAADQPRAGAHENAEKGRATAHPAESNEDIEQLKSKIDRLVLLVERQQRAMAEMEKRLNIVEAKPLTDESSPASLKHRETTSATPPTGTMNTGPDPGASQTQPAARIQKRNKS
jgi:hypothetical protein